MGLGVAVVLEDALRAAVVFAFALGMGVLCPIQVGSVVQRERERGINKLPVSSPPPPENPKRGNLQFIRSRSESERADKSNRSVKEDKVVEARS
jgi:hypothetical protein